MVRFVRWGASGPRWLVPRLYRWETVGGKVGGGVHKGRREGGDASVIFPDAHLPHEKPDFQTKTVDNTTEAKLRRDEGLEIS